MYRCQGCKCIVRPGNPLRRWVIYREVPVTKVVTGEIRESTRKEVETEINVCDSCLSRLKTGTPLSVIFGAPQAPPPPPAPEPEEETAPVLEQAPPPRALPPKTAKTSKPKNPIKKVVPIETPKRTRRK